MTTLLKEALLQLWEHGSLKVSCNMPYSMISRGGLLCCSSSSVEYFAGSAIIRKQMTQRTYFQEVPFLCGGVLWNFRLLQADFSEMLIILVFIKAFKGLRELIILKKK